MCEYILSNFSCRLVTYSTYKLQSGAFAHKSVITHHHYWQLLGEFNFCYIATHITYSTDICVVDFFGSSLAQHSFTQRCSAIHHHLPCLSCSSSSVVRLLFQQACFSFCRSSRLLLQQAFDFLFRFVAVLQNTLPKTIGKQAHSLSSLRLIFYLDWEKLTQTKLALTIHYF